MHPSALTYARRMALALAALSLVACDTFGPANTVRASDLPNKGLARLVGMKDVVFAWETAPACKLETVTGDSLPSTGWTPLALNALGGKTLEVANVRVGKRDGHGSVEWLALALREGPQAIRWVRNTPSTNEATVAASWRCVVDPLEKERLAPHLSAPKVRLAVDSAACAHFAPVLGGPDDLSVLPYDVTEKALFASAALSPDAARNGQSAAFVGVRLKATAGDGSLVVRGDDFDQCFVASDDVPQATGDATLAVARWLAADAPDPYATPSVLVASLRAATGVDLTHCAHDGDGPAEHYECVIPSLRVSTITGTALGGKPLEIVRERMVDAVHVYGGRLVPAVDAAARNVAIHTHVTGGSLATELSKALDASFLDPTKRQARGSAGWRLLRPQDISLLVEATDTLNLDISYDPPAAETVELSRNRSAVVSQKTVANPDFYRALRDYDRIRAELKTVLQVGAVAGPDRQKLLEKRLADAKQKVDETPKTTKVDNVQTFLWQGKEIRRKGTAKVRAVLRTPDGNAEFTTTFEVPFEVVDTEDANDPAHGLVAKHAKAPTVGDVDRALAAELVSRIDQLTAQALLQGHLAPGSPSIQPGSRTWALAAARRTVGDRPVALLSDWSEARPDVLKSPMVTIPFELPAGSEARCFVMTAIPNDARGDANLVFGIAPAAGSKRFVAIGRDARAAREASFELCGVRPGSYALGVWAGRDVETPGFLVSLFDSTPGAPHDDDVRAAMIGSPRAAAPGESPSLTVTPRP
jgi:hypothetical protein